MIILASNILSIDEAYRAREQNASIKRLSWITFIFLPLLFVAGLVKSFFLWMLSWSRRHIRAVLKRVRGTHSRKDLETNPERDGLVAMDGIGLELGHRTSTYRRLLALRDAVFAGNLQTVRLQLVHFDNGTKLNLRNELGASICNRALNDGREDIFLILKQIGINVNIRSDGETVIVCATRYGNLAIVKDLLKMGADLRDCEDKTGRSLLMLACKHGHATLVEFFLCKTPLGKDLDYLMHLTDRTTKRKTTAVLAAETSDPICFQLLWNAISVFEFVPEEKRIRDVLQLEAGRRTIRVVPGSLQACGLVWDLLSKWAYVHGKLYFRFRIVTAHLLSSAKKARVRSKHAGSYGNLYFPDVFYCAYGLQQTLAKALKQAILLREANGAAKRQSLSFFSDARFAALVEVAWFYTGKLSNFLALSETSIPEVVLFVDLHEDMRGAPYIIPFLLALRIFIREVGTENSKEFKWTTALFTALVQSATPLIRRTISGRYEYYSTREHPTYTQQSFTVFARNGPWTGRAEHKYQARTERATNLIPFIWSYLWSNLAQHFWSNLTKQFWSPMTTLVDHFWSPMTTLVDQSGRPLPKPVTMRWANTRGIISKKIK
ncbi:ankyrin [Ascobolus immersus RN42]|uniref:Ankyrin n=1 Tax=Ascobolus immersus RN42 TaxID=1160509 RepID=A0A3N4HQF5_ASCIM|nr:ankyrin [Ascobolus immersus RN42]